MEEEENETLPAWMRYMPRTGWTSSSHGVNEMGKAASTEIVKSSCKFSTTEVIMTRSRSKNSGNSGRDVIQKSQGGKVKKKLSLNSKTQTTISVSSKDLKERRRKYGNVNISEISELVSMSKLSQR